MDDSTINNDKTEAPSTLTRIHFKHKNIFMVSKTSVSIVIVFKSFSPVHTYPNKFENADNKRFELVQIVSRSHKHLFALCSW